MFFYLILNSTFIKKMKAKENEKNIRTLIFGVVSYTLLHAVINAGGDESLLYNFKNYFWIILLLDITINLFFDEKISSSFSKISVSNMFGNNNTDTTDDDDDVSPFRLIVPDATDEDINQNTINKNKNKNNRKKNKNSVSFSNPIISGNSMDNPSGNPMDNPIGNSMDNPIEHLIEEKLLSKSKSKSTPLSFFSVNDHSNFSDSDSDSDGDFTTDSEFNKFEKSLSL